MVLKAYLGPSVNSPNNSITVALSRFHWQDFHRLTREARPHPPPIPLQLLQDLISPLQKHSAIPFWLRGLAASTRKSYATAPSQFLSFCCQLGRIHSSGSPCPADEWTLCLFATFLAGSLQHSSIKVYLFGMRALHIKQRFADPLRNCLRLQRVIHGINALRAPPHLVVCLLQMTSF